MPFKQSIVYLFPPTPPPIKAPMFTVYDKEIKNGCPCIVEIRGTQGRVLVGDLHEP